MKPADNINNLFENSKITVSSDVDKKILNKATSALPHPAAQPDRHSWSIIMQSKLTKPLTATIIIIAGFLSLTLFNKTVPYTYGMNDVAQVFYNADTIHCWGKNYIYENFDDITETTEPNIVTFESWVDLKNRRYRENGFGTSRPYGGGKLSIEKNEYMLLDGLSTYLSRTKNYIFYNKYTPLAQKLSLRRKRDELANTILPEMLEGYEQIGQEKIEGRVYDIWQCDTLQGPKGNAIMQKCWVDPISRKIRQFYMYFIPKNGPQKWVLSVTREYKINIPINDNIFKIDISANCRRDLDNSTPETAGTQGLINGGAIAIKGVYLKESQACFILEDGSVITAWTSSTQQNLQQTESIKETGFAGAWPELPSILEKLTYIPNAGTPGGISLEVNYIGIPLANTIKDGKYIVWGLYVPTSEFPVRLPRYIYRTQWRHKENPNKLHPFNPISGPVIKSSEFNEFVLGAMAELSDDGIAPAGITYETVTQLSKKMRNDLAQ